MLFSPIFEPQPMHIPDGFLSAAVSLFFALISLPVIAAALRRTGRDLGAREAPLMGVLAAAIFAGQMLNFTVLGGTSGHLLGAALAAILLGPWPAVLVMTSVVAVQALVFQDGGLLVLGANVFNMAVIGVFVSFAVYSLVRRLVKDARRGILAGGFAAAWASIFTAAIAAGLQLALSGTSPANIAIPAMAAVHALIGLGEGLITTGALGFLLAARPDLLNGGEQARGSRAVAVGGAVLALGLAFLAPIASTHPDGLAWVAAQQGFLHLAQPTLFRIFAGYHIPGIGQPDAAAIAASLLGGVLVFAAAFAAARAAKRSSSDNGS